LYDQTSFLEVIKHFVLTRSFSKVRVLLSEPARVMRDSNRFVQWDAASRAASISATLPPELHSGLPLI